MAESCVDMECRDCPYHGVKNRKLICTKFSILATEPGGGAPPPRPSTIESILRALREEK